MSQTAGRIFIGKGNGDVLFTIRYSPALNTAGLTDVYAQIFGPSGQQVAEQISLVQHPGIPGFYTGSFQPISGLGDYVLVIFAPSIGDRVEGIYRIQDPESLFNRVDLNVISNPELIRQVVQRVAGQVAAPLVSRIVSSDIDMRLEMRALLEQHGRWVIYRRLDHRQRCSCRGREGHCPRCGGLGFPYTDELVLTYHFARGSYLSAQQFIAQIPLTKHDAVFYFSFDQEVRESDYVVEIVLDVNGNPEIPYRTKVLFDIVTAFPRISEGKVQFWEVYANEKPIR